MYDSEHRLCAAAPRQRGLSIIELMVGMVVALLVGITAMSSANFFTAAQRSSVGTGSASVNVASALAAIKSDVAQAGLGFFGNAQYSCNKLNLGYEDTVHKDGTDFSPLQVTRGADDNDQLEIVYGSKVESGSAVLLRSPTASNGAEAKLASYLPTGENQAVLLIPASATDPCTVRSVTGVAAAVDSTPQSLAFGSSGLYNKAAFSKTVNYDSGSTVASLGDLQWRRYSVQNGHLVMEQPLEASSGTDPSVLVRDVVAFQVQYGIASSDTDTTLVEWVDPTGSWAQLTGDNILQVRAIRIGVVARSPQREKPDPKTGECAASSSIPQPFGNSDGSSGAIPLGDDRKCWRYRTMNVVVPLRNIVLGRV